MIAKLTGLLDSLREDGAVIDVGGIGYLVFCSQRTMNALPPKAETVSLSIETHVREDHIHLYGFASQAEQDWFLLLLTVQGVGAKVALAVLSALAPDDIRLAIVTGDAATLMRANGVGRKVAQRVVGELKDKAGELSVPGVAIGLASAGIAAGIVVEGASADAISALVNLGYRRIEAAGAVGHAMHQLGTDASAEALIKAGLQELGS